MSENNMPNLKKSDNCSRCGACIAICPKGAISKKIIDGGQWVPVINNQVCIGCRKCEKVCAWEKKNTNDLKKSYVALNVDVTKRKLSASGGAFSAIASSFLYQGGIVCGAELKFVNGVPKIEHVLIDDEKGLNRILQSKYVQSDATVVFIKIKELLQSHKKILFSGTSCQVNALQAYLELEKVNMKGLYTIDLICHGTPPAELFSRYISFLSSKYKGIVYDFHFRSKTMKQISYIETISLNRNNEDIVISIPWRKSSYYTMFLGEESYNLGCYNCRYASINKPADITVGDYFELKNDNKELYDAIDTQNGVSALIIHSNKGEILLNAATQYIQIYECDLRKLIESHGNLRRPSKYSLLRCIAFSLNERLGYKSVDLFFYIREKVICIPRSILHKIRKIS